MTTVTSALDSSSIQSLIQQATASYQLPAATLQQQEQPVQAKISALGQIQSSLSSLQSGLAQLNQLTALPPVTANSSNNGVATASASATVSPGSYALTNVVLAQVQTVISSDYASASDPLGAGALTLQTGSASPMTINIPSGTDTLSGIAAAVNAANAGVTASVVYDGTGYRLTLTGTQTGAANAFTVSGTGGLAGLSYGVGTDTMTQTQAASDASFSLNGIAITSASNQVTTAVPGLTFSLTGAGSTTVTVATDMSSLEQVSQNVVQGLNNALATINKFDYYDPTSSTPAGPLLGDFSIDMLRQQLLGVVSGMGGSGLPVSTPYQSLSTIGFGLTSDGTVTLDTGALQSAANTNYAAVAALLGSVGTATSPQVSVGSVGSAQPGSYPVNITSNTGGTISGTVNGQDATGTDGVLSVLGAGPAAGMSLNIGGGVTGALGTVNVSQGLSGQLATLLNAVLDPTNGSLTNETNNLTASLTQMNQRIAALQQQAQQQTLLLSQQFANMEASTQQSSTVSNFLDSYFSSQSSGG